MKANLMKRYSARLALPQLIILKLLTKQDSAEQPLLSDVPLEIVEPPSTVEPCTVEPSFTF